MTDKPEHIIQKGHRAVVVITFAGRDEGFPWLNRMERLGVNALHLTDSNNRWYLDGADGDASFRETSERCKRYIAENSGMPVLIMGQSSGAYAALRASLYLQLAHTLAFAPQTHAVQHRVVPGGQRNFGPPEDIIDIRPHLVSHGGSTTIIVSQSEAENPPTAYFWDDHSHLVGLDGHPHIQIRTLDYRLHPTAWCLARDGVLNDVIDSEIARAADIVQAGEKQFAA